MFENILYQNGVIDSLTHDIKKQSIPGSILFYGPSLSGKLTTALELARVLCCEKEAKWSCDCLSCKQHLSMQNPYIILTGQKKLLNEISHSGEYLLENKTDKSRYIFIRNVRKLTKRFSDDLWNSEDAKYKKSIPSIIKIEELLLSIEPGQLLPKDQDLKKNIDSIIKESLKLDSDLPKGNIPINQIRNITTWVRQSTSGSKKVVILESAELMQESSRNSLLKILEEPPKNVYFILISEAKNKILPTILSRVRAYPFRERSEDEQKHILEILYERKDFSTISSFFSSYSQNNQNEIHSQALSYFNALLDKNSSFIDLIQIKLDQELFKSFLIELTQILQIQLRSNTTLNLSQIEMMISEIRDKIIKQNFFNQSPNLLIETLFYQLKRIVYA